MSFDISKIVESNDRFKGLCSIYAWKAHQFEAEWSKKGRLTAYEVDTIKMIEKAANYFSALADRCQRIKNKYEESHQIN